MRVRVRLLQLLGDAARRRVGLGRRRRRLGSGRRAELEARGMGVGRRRVEGARQPAGGRATTALARGGQREPRRRLGRLLQTEEAVQRRGDRLDGVRERRVRVGERVAVADGRGEQLGARAAERDGLLVVELGPLAPHPVPACRCRCRCRSWWLVRARSRTVQVRRALRGLE